MTAGKKVLHPFQLPTRAPVQTTAVAYLLLDHFNASGFVWGVVAVFVALLWLSFVSAFIHESWTRLHELGDK